MSRLDDLRSLAEQKKQDNAMPRDRCEKLALSVVKDLQELSAKIGGCPAPYPPEQIEQALALSRVGLMKFVTLCSECLGELAPSTQRQLSTGLLSVTAGVSDKSPAGIPFSELQPVALSLFRAMTREDRTHQARLVYAIASGVEEDDTTGKAALSGWASMYLEEASTAEAVTQFEIVKGLFGLDKSAGIKWVDKELVLPLLGDSPGVKLLDRWLDEISNRLSKRKYFQELFD